jgi:rhodanese-related sulfurtransferase
MPSSVRQMLEAANSEIPRISADEARTMVETEGALLVDVRDSDELARTGSLAGALHVSRGMVEFQADPEFLTTIPNFERIDRLSSIALPEGDPPSPARR